MRRSSVSLLSLLLATAPAFGGEKTMVFDINTLPPEDAESSQPSGFREAGPLAFFRAKTGLGFEPWVTDGTVAGTRILKDIQVGAGSSLSGGFTALPNGEVVFASTGPEGSELWKTDGTEAGTVLVKDIYPGVGNSYPNQFISFAGKVFFFAQDGSHGRELWSTDGTEAGTRLMGESQSGGAGVPINSAELVESGGKLFFGSPYGQLGHVLWANDGTAGGTYAVATVTANLNHPIANLVDLNGVLLFTAHDQLLGPEVWKSDGTPGGTHVLIDIVTPGGSHPDHLVRVGDHVLFQANHPGVGAELFRTDGTAGGTTIVADIEPSTTLFLNGSDPEPIAVVGNQLFFAASTLADGRELWVSDGSTAGTRMVVDLQPGTQSSLPVSGVVAGGNLFFCAQTPAGRHLMVTDGTPAGTVALDLLMSGDTPPMGALGGSLLYGPNDLEIGRELYLSDGTPAGTAILADLYSTNATQPSDPTVLTRAGDRLFFRADDGVHGRELWVKDEAGTRMVKDIFAGPGSSVISAIAAVGDKVWFLAYLPSTGLEPWVSDGTEAGTMMLMDIYPGQIDSNWSVPPHINFRGDVFFTAIDGDFEGGFYRTDGTPEGTERFGDLGSGPMASTGDKLFLASWDSATGNELYATDGTEEGVTLLGDIGPGTEHGFAGQKIWTTSSAAFFLGNDGVRGTEMWTSDGTPSGTRLVADLAPGSASIWVSRALSIGDTLLFEFVDTSGMTRVYSTDGTPTGTTLVYSTDQFLVSDFHRSGDTALFFLSSFTGQQQLFRTDGTPGGTTPIPVPSVPYYPFGFHTTGSSGVAAFVANDPQVGAEFHALDGSTVTLLADVNPGALGSSPAEMIRVGDELFFSADDGVHGRELHRVSLNMVDEFVAEPMGSGCAPIAMGMPTWQVTSPPVVGQTMAVSLNQAPAGGAALLIIGSSFGSLPFGGGCTLDVAAPFFALPFSVDPNGVGNLSAPIAPSLEGTRAWLDVVGVSSRGTFWSSPALEVIVSGQ